MKPTIITLGLLLPLLIAAYPPTAQEADQLYRLNRYREAISLYQKSLPKAKDSVDKAQIYYNIGECYRKLNDPVRAASAFELAQRRGMKNEQLFIRLGDAHLQIGDYGEALMCYQAARKYAVNTVAVDSSIAKCQRAMNWQQVNSRWKAVNVKYINSKDDDYSPTWSTKKSTGITFTSKRGASKKGNIDRTTGRPFSDQYSATVNSSGKWTAPAKEQGGVNLPKANDGSAHYNIQRNRMYFTRCESNRRKIEKCKIYYSDKHVNSWSDPIMIDFQLPAEILDSFNFRHPTISANEDVMVFSSDMKGTSGGVYSDLWISYRDAKTKTWSTPTRLPDHINTAGREGFPYLHPDGSLYFASDGHVGIGGLDVFMAPKINGQWSWGEPVNMQSPINSNADDFGLILDTKKQLGYVSSNRKGGKGGDDIWQVYYVPCKAMVKGCVTDSITAGGIANAKIQLTDRNGKILTALTNASGNFNLEMEEGMSYQMHLFTEQARGAKGESYFAPERSLIRMIAPSDECVDIDVMCKLKVIPPNEIKFPAVFFPLNSAELTKASKDSLDYLYRLLTANPNLVIELAAHTDSRAADVYNLELSNRRAKACVDYLVKERGIDSARLVAKGYGEARPLKWNNEQILTEKYIASCPKSEQELLHAMNRRTVFRVIRTNYGVKAGSEPTQPVKVAKSVYDESGLQIPADSED